jgi:peptidoglycan biosynthesis protein MviN/MurJ (putative lipid II flippase)
MRAMFLRAGLISLALLLASRLLGLLRESLQAAALGATGLADVAILMLTLPDLLTGILASGALAYVLLPQWAAQTEQTRANTHARLARVILAVGLLVGLLIALAPRLVVQLLAPGLGGGARDAAHSALWWSAVAMPLALLAALWTTHLQHCRDFSGMYGANLAVNAAIIGALLLIALDDGRSLAGPIALLGAGLLLGMCLRLVWLRWRLGRPTSAQAARTPGGATVPVPWPRAAVWLWALAGAGLPLLLPVLGRSLASTGGDGALATFSFAWKLIELPLVLAVQLVAAIAFPGMASAFAVTDVAPSEAQRARQREALRHAFVLAWVLACAAAAALVGTAPALAALLFGWGRMTPEAVVEVGLWSRAGAWSLLPQALLAVLSILMASTGRLRDAVIVHLGALVLLALLGWLVVGQGARRGAVDGAHVMWSINAALAIAAAALLWRARDLVAEALRLRDLVPAAATAAVLAFAAASLPPLSRLPGLGVALVVAALVLLAAWVCSPALREALRR